MSTCRALAEHYQQSLRDAQVLERIQRHYPGGATPYQLAPLDQLQSDKEQVREAPILSPVWVFGDRFEEIGKNLLENLSNRAIDVVEIGACC